MKSPTLADVARRLVPPIAVKGLRALRVRWRARSASPPDAAAAQRLGLVGNDATWKKAQADSGGYDADIILRKTADALGKDKPNSLIKNCAIQRTNVFSRWRASWRCNPGPIPNRAFRLCPSPFTISPLTFPHVRPHPSRNPRPIRPPQQRARGPARRMATR